MEIAGMAGKEYTWMEINGNGWTWLEWLEMYRHSCKVLEMAENYGNNSVYCFK